jgi:cyclase
VAGWRVQGKAHRILAFRLIARLDIKAPHLVKTVNLDGMRILGDPAEYARRYDRQGIDEILYLDIVASLYGRNSLHDLIERTTADVFTPVTVGGGVRSVDDALSLLRAGADKIALNTAAIKRPELITELAHKIGSQSVVLQIDAKRKSNGWEAWCEGGREPTGKDAIAWAQEGEARGAGEILITSVDCEGCDGPDTGLAEAAGAAVGTPVVLSGGVTRPAHIVSAHQAGCSGVACAGALHLGDDNTLPVMRAGLVEAGVPVRMAA